MSKNISLNQFGETMLDVVCFIFVCGIWLGPTWCHEHCFSEIIHLLLHPGKKGTFLQVRYTVLVGCSTTQINDVRVCSQLCLHIFRPFGQNLLVCCSCLWAPPYEVSGVSKTTANFALKFTNMRAKLLKNCAYIQMLPNFICERKDSGRRIPHFIC